MGKLPPAKNVNTAPMTYARTAGTTHYFALGVFINCVYSSRVQKSNINICTLYDSTLFTVPSAISLVHMVLESVRAVVVNYESNYYFFFSVKIPTESI